MVKLEIEAQIKSPEKVLHKSKIIIGFFNAKMWKITHCVCEVGGGGGVIGAKEKWFSLFCEDKKTEAIKNRKSLEGFTW